MGTRCANASAPEAVIALTVPREGWTMRDPKRPRIEPGKRARLLLHGGNRLVDDVAAIAIDGSLDELYVRYHDARDHMASFDRVGSIAWPACLFMVPIRPDHEYLTHRREEGTDLWTTSPHPPRKRQRPPDAQATRSAPSPHLAGDKSRTRASVPVPTAAAGNHPGSRGRLGRRQPPDRRSRRPGPRCFILRLLPSRSEARLRARLPTNWTRTVSSARLPPPVPARARRLPAANRDRAAPRCCRTRDDPRASRELLTQTPGQ